MENEKLLFVCYWELNENMPVEEHLMLGKKLLESGLFPPPGIELIRFDMTPGYWGITVFKAASSEDAFACINIWRTAGTGVFKKINVSPALTVMDASALGSTLYQTVKEAEANM